MTRKLVALSAVAALSAGLVVGTAGVANAWATDQNASASCEGTTVVIDGSFTNKEPKNAGTRGDMNVTMVFGDLKDGPKKVVRQTSEDFVINTGLSVLDSGTVRFDLTWADGRPGYDKRFAKFDAVDCRRVVTPSVEQTTPTCKNPNVTLTGVAQEGVTWDSESVVIKPGKSGTITATLDEDTILAEGAQTVFTVTNNFDKDSCFVPVKKPKGHIKCGCSGNPSATLNNHRSNVPVTFRAKAVYHGHVVFRDEVKVRAGKVRSYSFGGDRRFKPGTKLVLRAHHRVLDRLWVGPRCPDFPDSGLRFTVPKG